MRRNILLIATILSLAGVLNAQYLNTMGLPTSEKPSDYQLSITKTVQATTPYTIVNVIPSPVNYSADIAFDGNLIWTEGYAEYALYGLNTVTGVIEDTIEIDIKRPYGLTFDGQYFWVLDNENKLIQKIDSETKLVVDIISIEVNDDTYPTSVAIVDNTLWYNDTRGAYPNVEGDLTRKIDNTGTHLGSDSVCFEYPTGIVKINNVVWISDNASQTISEIDIQTKQILRVIEAPGGFYPNGLTFDGQYLWVSNNDADSIYQLDIGISVAVLNTPVLQDIVAECSVEIDVPTTTNSIGEVVIGQTNQSLNYNQQGTHVITWNFTDGNGNSIDVTQNILIEDTTAPEVPILVDVIGECNATAVAPTTTDACSGTIIGTTSDDLTYSTQGTHVITWNFEDNNGNSIDVTQKIIVSDKIYPIISCSDDLSVMALNTIAQNYVVNGNEFDPSSVSDNCEIATVTNDYNQLNSLVGEVFSIGTTPVVWTVTDVAGNITTCTNFITVEMFTEIYEQNNAADLNIYPNPSNGNFTVQYSNTSNNASKLSVIDITGKVVYNDVATVLNTKINLTNISSGVYYLIIEQKNLVINKKIIITHSVK